VQFAPNTADVVIPAVSFFVGRKSKESCGNIHSTSQMPPYSLYNAPLLTRALSGLVRVVHYIGNRVPFGTHPESEGECFTSSAATATVRKAPVVRHVDEAPDGHEIFIRP
jgi:hypothetical protein